LAREIAIAWQLGPNFGWGLFGLEIALRLKASGRARPMLLSRMLPYLGDPAIRAELEEIWARHRGAIQGMHEKNMPGARVRVNVPVLTALGNDAARQFINPSLDYRGTENHGLVFLENPSITPQARDIYNGFDTMIAGSSWARDILRANGVRGAEVCIQGIDPTLFHLSPDRGVDDAKPFRIFSGGKLEFRKGQDIVLKAVRGFRDRHPDVQLTCIWGNPWYAGSSFKLLRHSPHFPGMLDHAGPEGINWSGIFEDAGMDLGQVQFHETVDNWALPEIMREADVALFPNRCEGGTNMMAMQAMACGVPCILSANSGHLDIIEEDACIPLRAQKPVAMDEPTISTEGWGESDVDEILECLEAVYRNRGRAREIGMAGAEMMAALTWKQQIAALAPLIGL